MLRLFIAFLLFLPDYRHLTAQDLSHSEMIQLPNFQRQQLLKDRPLSDYHLESSSRVLWIAGQNYLWRWEIADQELSRMKLPIPTDHSLSQYRKFLALTSDKLLLATDEQLFLVEANPIKIHEFRSSSSHLSVTMGLSKTTATKQETARAHWVKSDGIYTIDLEKMQSMQTVRFRMRLDAAKKAIVNGDLVWLHYPQKIETYQIDTHEVQTVLRTKEPIHDMQLSGEGEVFALTDRGVVRFDQTAAIIQILPVEVNAQPQAFSLDDRMHAYLFSDRYTEVYRLDKKSHHLYQISVDTKAKQIIFLTSDALMLVGHQDDFELRVL